MSDPRTPEKTKKTGAINGRIPAELRTRLDAIGERYGVSDAVMLADALTALADFVEAAKKYERPMRMVQTVTRGVMGA